MNTATKLHSASVLTTFVITTLFLLTACSKEDVVATAYVCASCSDSPDALAANDVSARGVYKGILVGSSGTISINIQNGSSTISATMVLDGTTANLTSSVSVIDGEPYVAPFTGTFNGSAVSVVFSVGAGGGQPTMISSDIPGHPNTVFELYKETSTSMIEAFEGDITAPGETGTFNIIMARSIGTWGYIVQINGSESTETGSGTISGNDLITDGDNIGTITGDVINGTFVNGNNETIVISGQRTL